MGMRQPFRHLPGRASQARNTPVNSVPTATVLAHVGAWPTSPVCRGTGVAVGRGVAVAHPAHVGVGPGVGVSRGVGGIAVGSRRSAVGRPLPATVGQGRAVGVAVGEGRGAGVGVGPLITGTTSVPNSMYFRPQASQASKRTGYSPGGAKRPLSQAVSQRQVTL